MDVIVCCAIVFFKHVQIVFVMKFLFVVLADGSQLVKELPPLRVTSVLPSLLEGQSVCVFVCV